jgi:hypothetical protein
MTEQQALPLRAAYPFGLENGLEKEIVAIRDMEIEWDDESQSFAAETDLRDFLAKNPARIEAGCD